LHVKRPTAIFALLLTPNRGNWWNSSAVPQRLKSDRRLGSNPVEETMTRALAFALIFIALTTHALASDSSEVTLPPIVKDVSPIDFLAEDPIVPVLSGETKTNTSEGSVQHTLTNELPYAATDPSLPGQTSQFLGLGSSSEDTDIQTLGIPLNSPQGGGFDFSTFPQFLWSDYRFQPGPSAASLDTRGIAGTLSLMPWTAQAIAQAVGQNGEEKGTGQFTGLYSTSDLTQLSIAGQYGDRAAILVGNSSGLLNGPSGSLSTRIYHDDRLDIRFHLLTTDLDATLRYNPPDPISSHDLVVRNIPVLQVDWNISPDVKFKSSIYYDNTYLRDEDFSAGYFTQERVQQVGTENALFVSGWKFGASIRKVAFAQYSNNVPFVAPDETTASFQISKLLVLAGEIGNRLMLEGTAELTDVNRFGSYPEGTAGIRQEWDSGRSGIYARGNFTRRFPSLVDRFYVFEGFTPNPGLTPEKDFTAIEGIETRQSRWDASAQIYEQLRENAEATITDQNGNFTPVEAGNAHLFSLVLTAGVRPVEELRVFNSANFTRTHVDFLNAAFPYIPNFIDVLGAEATLGHGFAADADARFQSSAYTGPGKALASTSYLDLGASYDLNTRIKLLGRVENITDNQVILSPEAPPKDRVFSVAISGAL
jgi:hypothetical protein